MAGLDGMEAVNGSVLTAALEDAAPFLGDAERLGQLAARDGFLFIRGLAPEELVLALRARVLDFASAIGWLDPDALVSEARALAGKRIGYYQDPEWVSLQAHVQTCAEMWALGDCVAIHRVLHAVAGRSSYLCLSTANTCRVFSPHPDMATQPHQDANYVRMIGDFWTVWVPLGHCPLELGPLALLAGSHRGGLQEHAGEGIVDGGVVVPGDAVWSADDLRCGDAILFQPYTLHRSLPNRSGDRLRLSVDFRYGFWESDGPLDWRASALGTLKGDPLTDLRAADPMCSTETNLGPRDFDDGVGDNGENERRNHGMGRPQHVRQSQEPRAGANYCCDDGRHECRSHTFIEYAEREPVVPIRIY